MPRLRRCREALPTHVRQADDTSAFVRTRTLRVRILLLRVKVDTRATQAAKAAETAR